jgi:hypothetical protein
MAFNVKLSFLSVDIGSLSPAGMKLSAILLIPITTLAAICNAIAGNVHFDDVITELEKFQNLASYGPFHITPDPGGMYVRLIFKVHNVSDSPKTVWFGRFMIRDEAGRTYSTVD